MVVLLKSHAVLREVGRERIVLKPKSDLFLLLLSTAAKSLLNKKSDGVKVSSCFPISLSLLPSEQEGSRFLWCPSPSRVKPQPCLLAGIVMFSVSLWSPRWDLHVPYMHLIHHTAS